MTEIPEHLLQRSKERAGRASGSRRRGRRRPAAAAPAAMRGAGAMRRRPTPAAAVAAGRRPAPRARAGRRPAAAPADRRRPTSQAARRRATDPVLGDARARAAAVWAFMYYNSVQVPAGERRPARRRRGGLRGTAPAATARTGGGGTGPRSTTARCSRPSRTPTTMMQWIRLGADGRRRGPTAPTATPTDGRAAQHRRPSPAGDAGFDLVAPRSSPRSPLRPRDALGRRRDEDRDRHSSELAERGHGRGRRGPTLSDKTASPTPRTGRGRRAGRRRLATHRTLTDDRTDRHDVLVVGGGPGRRGDRLLAGRGRPRRRRRREEDASRGRRPAATASRPGPSSSSTTWASAGRLDELPPLRRAAGRRPRHHARAAVARAPRSTRATATSCAAATSTRWSPSTP